jgi:hypothetical protein
MPRLAALAFIAATKAGSRRVVPAQRVRGAVLAGTSAPVQHVAAGQRRAHRQARAGVLLGVDIVL